MSDSIFKGAIGEEHFIAKTNTFVEVILPVATPKPTYTYYVDEEHLDQIQFGVRVEVQFGKNKLYSWHTQRASDKSSAKGYRERDG